MFYQTCMGFVLYLVLCILLWIFSDISLYAFSSLSEVSLFVYALCVLLLFTVCHIEKYPHLLPYSTSQRCDVISQACVTTNSYCIHSHTRFFVSKHSTVLCLAL